MRARDPQARSERGLDARRRNWCRNVSRWKRGRIRSRSIPDTHSIGGRANAMLNRRLLNGAVWLAA